MRDARSLARAAYRALSNGEMATELGVVHSVIRLRWRAVRRALRPQAIKQDWLSLRLLCRQGISPTDALARFIA
ncbi:MAG TPA: hypothetical protein VG518_09695 [Solirubrobacterales bacterium]|nr:hypothetical protein [Solirubrobacterales bacterium]